MTAMLYRLIQSRHAKLRGLHQFLWNRRATHARRRNTYVVEQLENRYLLSADIAPFAPVAELLDDEPIVEQVIDTSLADAERSQQLEPLVYGVRIGQVNSSERALLYRIADLDAQLARSPEDLRQEELRRMWGQRVALLESLAQVRRTRATLQPTVY